MKSKQMETSSYCYKFNVESITQFIDYKQKVQRIKLVMKYLQLMIIQLYDIV